LTASGNEVYTLPKHLDEKAVSLHLSKIGARLAKRKPEQHPGPPPDGSFNAERDRLQEIAYGGMSKVTQRRLMTLAAEFETGGAIAPPPGPKIKPGSRREWRGRTHTVCVTDDGFEFQGKSYRSLTKIAHDITGAQWSGPRFFGLTKRSATATATPDNLATGAQTASENSNG